MEKEIKLTNADFRLLSIVWDTEPISSPELCKLAESQLGWKRTTTYTVLKRLGDKKILLNLNAIVTSLMGRAAVQQFESRQVLSRGFEGSIPQFIAAFLSGETISEKDAEQIKRMIDAFRETKE